MSDDGVYGELAELLASGRFDALTCDVFDTLLWRPSARPTDVFVELGRRLQAAGLIDAALPPTELSGARQEAEAVARRLLRRNTGSLECTLTEIWEAMPTAITGATPVADFVAAELECEAARVRAHDPIAELLTLAKRNRMSTTLVSDTYLADEQLAALATTAGVDMANVDRVVTSSTARVGKADGLMAHVIDELGVPASRVLHVGDNPVSDVATARALGATAVSTDRLANGATTAAVSVPGPTVVAYSDRTGTDGALTAAVRETLLAHTPKPGTTGAYQFGAAVVGPALAGFSAWASSEAERLGAGTVHCLLREGAVIADLMRVTRPDGPAPRLVHGSRWAMVRAAVMTGTEDEILAAVERRVHFRPQHVADAFGLAIGDVTRVVGDRMYDHTSRFEAIAAIAADDVLRQQIVDASARIRANTMRYLEQALTLDDRPLVVCDIGWGGKIQACLQAILADAGHTGAIVGLYLMLSETGVRRRRAGATMLSYLPETVGSAHVGPAATFVQSHAAILERVATPQLGTLLDFTPDGEPICRPADHEAHPASLVAARRGVYDVTTRLARMHRLDTAPWSDTAFRAALLDQIADTLASPSPLLAGDLAGWTHDDLAGDDPEALVSGAIPALARFLNPVDATAIGWDELFWMPGLAAVANPALGAQLGAAQLGIAAERLAVPSETGVARIATFPTGSGLASHQIEGVPSRSAEGWCLMRLHCEVPSSRGLRLDAGADACLMQLGHLDVIVTSRDDSGERRQRVPIADLTDRRLRWIDGRALARELGAFASGGHLLLDLTEFDGVARVDVDWAFRTWPLAATDARIAAPSLPARCRATVSRVASRLRRMTGGGS